MNKNRRNLLTMVSVAISVIPAMAVAQPISVEGSAPAPKRGDASSIRYNAIADARRKLVDQLSREALGPTAANLPIDVQDRILSLITVDKIRILREDLANGRLIVSISADIDRAWFRDRLDELGIISQQRKLSNDVIVIMLDMNYGTSRDLLGPKEIVRAGASSQGGSYSDTSTSTSYSKQGYSGSSSTRQRAAMSAASTAVAGSSNGYAGAEAGFAASGAYSNKARSKSSSIAFSDDRANVQAEVHDDQWYYERIISQDETQQAGSPLVAIGALQARLQGMGLEVQSVRNYADFFKNRTFQTEKLIASGEMNAFRQYLAERGIKFFITGNIVITDGASAGMGNYINCSGTMNAEVTSTTENRAIGSGFIELKATGPDAQSCQNTLVSKLSESVGTQIGDYVNKYYTRAEYAFARDAQIIKKSASENVEYTVSFIGPPQFNFPLQKRIQDLMQSLPGAETLTKVSSDSKKITYSVFYKGKQPIDLSIAELLASDPNMNGFESKASGLNVTFCLSGCK